MKKLGLQGQIGKDVKKIKKKQESETKGWRKGGQREEEGIALKTHRCRGKEVAIRCKIVEFVEGFRQTKRDRLQRPKGRVVLFQPLEKADSLLWYVRKL